MIDKTNGPNVEKHLDMHIKNQVVPRTKSIGSSKIIVGYRVQIFCNRSKIDNIEAPFNNHRSAFRLVKNLIQTKKDILACIKEEKLATNLLHIKHALRL